jgi:deaminated glutathione amidase
MRVAVVQMNSQETKDANLRQAESLIDGCVAAERPDLIVLPEVFTLMGENRGAKLVAAEDEGAGEAWKMLADRAKRHGVHVHGGSILERASADKLFNTTYVFDPAGKQIAKYRKIHLFDVTTPDGQSYRESASFEAGSEVVTYKAGDATIGCTICYDLRFPELYQALAKKGADVIIVPAAFTLQTGKDHWEVLLRARAIETETYVVASAQAGTHANGTRACWGHSLIADPWGLVLARAQEGIGFASARIDLGYLRTVRGRIPVMEHKRL